MTPQQKRLYDIIKAELDASGVCPSYEEMAGTMGLKSKSGIFPLVNALEEQGYIYRRPHRARSIQLDVVLAGPKWKETVEVVRAARGVKIAPSHKEPTVTITKNSYQALQKALAKLRAI